MLRVEKVLSSHRSVLDLLLSLALALVTLRLGGVGLWSFLLKFLLNRCRTLDHHLVPHFFFESLFLFLDRFLGQEPIALVKQGRVFSRVEELRLLDRRK